MCSQTYAPDSGHYSQSVPGGDCEFQCSLSTCISASPTSASQADEDGMSSVVYILLKM